MTEVGVAQTSQKPLTILGQLAGELWTVSAVHLSGHAPLDRLLIAYQMTRFSDLRAKSRFHMLSRS